MKKTNNIMTLLTIMVLAIILGVATPATGYAASDEVYIYEINGTTRTLTLDRTNKIVQLDVDGEEYTIIDGITFRDAALSLDGTLWVYINKQLYWWNYDLQKNEEKINLHKINLECYHDYVDCLEFDSEFITIEGFENSTFIRYDLISYEEQEKFLTDLANGVATEDDAPVAIQTDSENSTPLYFTKECSIENNVYILYFNYINVILFDENNTKMYFILNNDNVTYATFDLDGTVWIWKNGDLYWWNCELQKDEEEINLHKLELPDGLSITDLEFDSSDDFITSYKGSDNNSYSLLTFDEQKAIINPSGSGNDSGNTGSGDSGSGNTDSGNSGSGDSGLGNTNSGNSGSGDSDSGNTDSGNSGSGNSGSGDSGSGNTNSGNTGSGDSDPGNTDSGNTGSGNTGSGNTGSNDSQSGASQPIEVDKPAPEKPVVDTPKVKKGDTFTKSNIKYKVTSTSTVVISKASASIKKATIPATIKYKGTTFKVVSVEANAFKDCKKLTNITIGKNIKTIKTKAFYNCKSLKKITVKSTVLSSCGKNAFKGINKKAVITVPKNKLKAYKKLFKNKGQGKQVKIK